MVPSRLTPYLQLTLAIFIIGSSIVAGKMIIKTLPIMLSTCFRFIIASLVLLVLLYYRERPFKLPNRRDLITLFLQALTGIFLFSICLLYGLKHTNAIEAGLMMGTLPAITAVFALIMLHETLNRWQVFGITLTVVGAVLLNTLGDHAASQTSSSSLGILLVFSAVVFEALFIIFGKQTSKNLSALKISTFASIFGCLLFLPFASWEAYYFDFSQATLLDWSLVLYFALVVSVSAFWLFYAGLSKVPATVAGSFMALLPLSAVLCSNLILGEPILKLHVIAGSFVIVGILLTAIASKRKPILNADNV